MTKRINHHTATFYVYPEVWNKFNEALGERGITKNFIFRQLIVLLGFMEHDEVESLLSLFSSLIKEHELGNYVTNVPTSLTKRLKEISPLENSD